MQIEGIKDGLVVETCTVRKEMGQHSRLTLTAHLTDGKESFYLQQVGKPIMIVQSFDLHKTGPIVFSGIVETVDIQQTFHQSVLCLCAVSSSHFLDQQERCRIFQDSSKKMGDILDGERLALAKDMKSGDVKLQVAESLKKCLLFRRSFKIGKVIFPSSGAAQRPCRVPYGCRTGRRAWC